MDALAAAFAGGIKSNVDTSRRDNSIRDSFNQLSQETRTTLLNNVATVNNILAPFASANTVTVNGSNNSVINMNINPIIIGGTPETTAAVLAAVTEWTRLFLAAVGEVAQSAPTPSPAFVWVTKGTPEIANLEQSGYIKMVVGDMALVNAFFESSRTGFENDGYAEVAFGNKRMLVQQYQYLMVRKDARPQWVSQTTGNYSLPANTVYGLNSPYPVCRATYHTLRAGFLNNAAHEGGWIAEICYGNDRHIVKAFDILTISQ